MKEIDINKILEQEPTLSPSGIERPGINMRQFLPEHIAQIKTCVDWLQTKTLSKTMNKISGSYGIKHVIERELKTYVANGCLIAAAIYLGIPYEKGYDSRNVHFPISRREIYKNDPANQRLSKRNKNKILGGQ